MEGSIFLCVQQFPTLCIHPTDQHYPLQKDGADAAGNLVEYTVSAGEQGFQC